MRIIGVDPGLQRTGWGVVDHQNGTLVYVACGVITSVATQPLATRLRQLFEGLGTCLTTYEPHQAVVETVYVNRNAQTSLTLGYARGAVLTALGCAQVPVHTVEPRLLKQAITGSGRAPKEQVAFMVRRLLPKTPQGLSADATDALAMAIYRVPNPPTVAPSTVMARPS